MLTAGPGCAIGVDLEVRRIDFDINIVVDNRIDPDRAEAGMAASRTIVGTDADQTVYTAFGLGIAIRIFALEQQRGALDAGLIARLMFDRLDLEAAPFGPAGVSK